MSSNNNYLQEFLQSVCNEIRFKGIHKSIAKELSDHIEDQKYEYIDQGLDEETATIKAVEQMGDPVIVGQQLNNAHKPRIEWSILSISTVLVIIGAAVQYFLSGASESAAYLFPRFLMYAPVGIAAFVAMYFFDYTLLGRYSKHIYFVLLILTAIGIMLIRPINGTHKNVYYSTLLFIPIFAGIVYGYINKGYLGIVFSGVFYAGVAFMCILASSPTSLFIFTLSSVVILTAAILKGFFNCNKKIAIAMIYIPLLFMLLFILFALPAYQYERIASVINPHLDPLGIGYVPLIVRTLLTSAKPFGTALIDSNITSSSIERMLPEWTSDFSLTYLIAKVGYIPGILIIMLFLALTVRMFVSVSKQKDTFGFLISLSAWLTIIIQIVLNILSNLGISTSLYRTITLPFISFGALGFIVNMALIGLLLSVYRRKDIIIKESQRTIE
jgi:cell division protein FtsW (lipid II flippase)